MVVNSLLRRFLSVARRENPGFADSTAHLELKQGISVSLHDDGLVALDPRSGVVFSANRIGALIWTRLEQRASIQAIAAEISRAYRIDGALALTDLCRFLADLQRRGLLRTAPTR